MSHILSQKKDLKNKKLIGFHEMISPVSLFSEMTLEDLQAFARRDETTSKGDSLAIKAVCNDHALLMFHVPKRKAKFILNQQL